MKTVLLCALVVSSAAWAESAAGIQWTPPASWKTEAPRQMRVATYQIPATKGDTEGAECGVFYFGSGQGGGVDANVDRWVGQFQQPDGKPAKDAAKIRKEKVKDFPVTTVEVSGTYTGMGGPFAPGAPKPGYKLSGAIVEAPQGAVFFKLTGPEKTVNAAQHDFQKMLKSIK